MQGRGGSWRQFQLHSDTTGPTQDGSPVHRRTGTSNANELARNVAEFWVKSGFGCATRLDDHLIAFILASDCIMFSLMANCCSWFRRWRKPKRYVKQNTSLFTQVNFQDGFNHKQNLWILIFFLKSVLHVLKLINQWHSKPWCFGTWDRVFAILRSSTSELKQSSPANWHFKCQNHVVWVRHLILLDLARNLSLILQPGLSLFCSKCFVAVGKTLNNQQEGGYGEWLFRWRPVYCRGRLGG